MESLCCGRLGKRLFTAPYEREQEHTLTFRFEMPTHAAAFQVGLRMWLGAQYLSKAPLARSEKVLSDLYSGVRLSEIACSLWHEACRAGTPLIWSGISQYERLRRDGDGDECYRDVLTTAWWRMGWGLIMRAVDGDRECCENPISQKGCCGMLPVLYERALDMRDPACDAFRVRSRDTTLQAYALIIAVNEVNMGAMETMSLDLSRLYHGESPHKLLGWDGIHPYTYMYEPPNRHMEAQWREGVHNIEFGLFVMANCDMAETNNATLVDMAGYFRCARYQLLPWKAGTYPICIPPPSERALSRDHSQLQDRAARAFYETGFMLVEKGLRCALAAYSCKS
ncbi:protein ORF135 [Cyprinid herpesvirus 1]|uniref:Protein ORF135 n=1 Tax=Cyprinid herpesvirus 1 TaxID=317858 RepID=K7PBE2_9VIRU|nr:protein ORF135 [Cyprinid herpesvirus 1]AFJ20424.1 protein ORF135 [Cyprinid herpesvirus 1]